MKILYIGCVEFSAKVLSKLIQINTQTISVITKKRSNFNSDFVDLGPICEKYGIEYKYVTNINHKKNVQYIQSVRPDIIFCFGWSQLISKQILDIPKHGVIGFHPTLLPQNRGRHPLIWALALGLNETGSTFFFMDEGADSGKIISQEKVSISYEDDARILYDKITATALKQVEEFLPKIEDGTLRPIIQDESKANYWRKRTEKDGEIDWRMSSRNIYNLVRALTKPYVGAHFIYNDQKIKVWRVREHITKEYENIEPGKVLSVSDDNTILVKTGNNCIEILEPKLGSIIKPGEYLWKKF